MVASPVAEVSVTVYVVSSSAVPSGSTLRDSRTWADPGKKVTLPLVGETLRETAFPVTTKVTVAASVTSPVRTRVRTRVLTMVSSS